LARELARRPDLLLLDEPTNHLDLPGIVWLERLLRDAPFAYVVATHDRAFLRAVADEVVEISRVYPGGYYRAPGSYDQFAERRAGAVLRTRRGVNAGNEARSAGPQRQRQEHLAARTRGGGRPRRGDRRAGRRPARGSVRAGAGGARPGGAAAAGALPQRRRHG